MTVKGTHAVADAGAGGAGPKCSGRPAPDSREEHGMVKRKRLAVLATLLALVATPLLASASLAACGDDIEPPTSQINIAKDVSMKTEILSIETGIKSYIAANGQVPPTADQNTLGGFVQPWPENPYTKVPMQPGTNPGEYTYTALGGTSFKLVAHLSGGKDYERP
jgi:hypothetical protein